MTVRDATAATLATLEARWGAAAPHRLGARPAGLPGDPSQPLLSTGFSDLDAILGPGGLPRAASLALVGDATSGRTTIALRLVAEAQASGVLVAWLDLTRSLDPVEAVARGVDLAWLVVLTPPTLEEGLAMGGALLGGRAVDLLVVDLPEWLPSAPPGPERLPSAPPPSTRPPRPAARARPGDRPPSLAVRLERLGALARRSGTTLVVLGPPGLPASLRGALDEATSLRLAARRRGWIRLGRDVVGQRLEVSIERSRIGPPGRRTELRILYADGGDRDACLRRPDLIQDDRPRTIDDATPPPSLAPSPPPTRPGALSGLRLVPEPGRARRAAVGGRDRPRPRPRCRDDGRPARDEPRGRASARP